VSIINSILRTDLCAFTQKCFYSLEPGTDYLHGAHIEQIMAALQNVESGKTKRLVINMPPRYLKSMCVSVAWSAWLLGHNPARKIIAASHSMDLSTKHNVDVRKILQSKWFKSAFPSFKFAADQNEKQKFMSNQFGFRLAASVNSNITGEGADIIIVDDPLTPEQSYCKHTRTGVLRWFDQTLSTRLNDKKKGAIVVVAQRLHADDLCGELLSRTGWEHLCLPAINDAGQLLHEAREGWDEIKQVRQDLGEYGFAAQYLQAPLKLDSGLIKASWLRYFDELPSGAIYQSWDTAIKVGQANDYSVCITFVEAANGFYVADIFRDKLEYPDLKRKIESLADKWKPIGVLLEDKASGQSLLQDLRMASKLPLIAVMPRQDKIQRLAAVSPLIEAGKLFLPKHNLLELELCQFPEGKHDDMVDALSQFLNWTRARKQPTEVSIRRI
jgi:predicted phage terminase large subunit-like protein